MSRPEIPRDDVAAALAARRELGEESDPAVIDAFLDRAGAAIDARVDERLAARTERRAPGPPRGMVPLALGSMGIGIAVTGASSGLDSGGALVAIVAWVAIAVINIVYATQR
jgi:hypothetical protein